MQRFLYHWTSAFTFRLSGLWHQAQLQRAALVKHGGADARPVLRGETLQVQNGAGDAGEAIVRLLIYIWWLSRAMISSCSSLPMVVK